jgi:hypothetical protein
VLIKFWLEVGKEEQERRRHVDYCDQEQLFAVSGRPE